MEVDMKKIMRLFVASLMVVQASAAMADTKANQITKSTQSIPIVGAVGSIPVAAVVGGVAFVVIVAVFAIDNSSGSHGSNIGN